MAFNDTNRKVHLASTFLVSCGLVLLKAPLPSRSPSSASLSTPKPKIIILENHRAGTGIYVLPKGRTEPGESLSETAVRETTEETGYPCQLLPLPIPSNQPNVLSTSNTEPIGIQFRNIRKDLLKIVYFFVGITSGEMGPRSEEELEYDVLEVDIDRGIELLTHEEDKDLVKLVKKLLETRNEKL